MNNDELIARSHATLAAHALSLCEHFLMCSAGYRVNVGPEAIIRHAAGVSEGDPRGTFTEGEYRDALASCLRRGLLKVLGPEDFAPDGQRVYLRDTPLLTQEGFADYAPGHVEFTAQGYRTHAAVLLEIFEDRRTAGALNSVAAAKSVMLTAPLGVSPRVAAPAASVGGKRDVYGAAIDRSPVDRSAVHGAPVEATPATPAASFRGAGNPEQQGTSESDSGEQLLGQHGEPPSSSSCSERG